MRLLADEAIVIGVIAYPEPRDAIGYADTENSIPQTNTRRPVLADLL
jgi:hypothetical protein